MAQEVLIAADGSQHPGPFVARDGAFVHPRDASKRHSLAAVDRLIFDAQGAPLRPKPGQFLRLRSGDCLRITAARLDSSRLRASHWQLRELQFERSLLASLQLASLQLAPCTSVPTAAVRPGVRLLDGSFSALRPERLDGAEVRLQHELLGSFRWPSALLSELIFDPNPQAFGGVRVAASLESGERIVGELLSLDSQELRLKTAWEPPAGQPLRLPRRILRELVVLGGELEYLADLPTANTPAAAKTPTPAAGRSLQGAPCILGERALWQSLACTPGTRLTYELPAGARQLRMQIGNLSGPGARLTIFGEGRPEAPLYELDLKAISAPNWQATQSISIEGIERLVLEVMPLQAGQTTTSEQGCILIGDPRILSDS